ncbi:AFR205Cp [Eremothecium gossypii ATCC 10895]|uniref:[RNA-polymerase]-subunit kinase n=1 Tax=Eremothecium gossypii (strain ATCC 10895 / CBS 109.51 / FGSC 9923 / NRRL Y-1056) TaxID=284811 RepID=Q753W7_EREGS|nr:AFR205Cp [Eremothecium gossypii ATCC 10895]AAS53576.1 AFR205Cp [Eremothecium gossypii ATCC 10895]AEY97889.1 FAFR205Cp [Eremothecium gossypii FDAG1]
MSYNNKKRNGSFKRRNGGDYYFPNKRPHHHHQPTGTTSRYNNQVRPPTEPEPAAPAPADVATSAAVAATRQSRFQPHRALPKAPRQVSRYNNGNLPAPPAGPASLRVPATIITHTHSVESSYQRITQVGEGTYGKVYKCRNIYTNKLVALKKLRLETERDGFPITSIREIKLLQHCQHENVSTIAEIMCEAQKTVYMIFEYADNDLSGLLMNKEIHFSDANCKHLFRQLLKGMEYLHECRILHRDIKGSNILIDNRGNLKITDFGLARKMKQEPDYTNRVITLWYRPPELLLGTTRYGTEVDMWGCGCLLVELFLKAAFFQGTNELEQLRCIFQVLGTPTIEQWPGLFDMPWWFMMIPQQKENYPSRFDEKVSGVLPTQSCRDLARGLLLYDQKKRFSASEALKSAYFYELPRPEPLNLGDFDGCHEFEARRQRRKEREETKKAAAASASSASKKSA